MAKGFLFVDARVEDWQSLLAGADPEVEVMLIDAGADAVIAHHHHRLLPLEEYQGRPIFWGMGNFVWARNNADWNTTAVAEIVVGADGSITGRLIAAFIAGHGHPVLLGRPDPTLWSEPPPFD